jgi:hypothetical protein
MTNLEVREQLLRRKLPGIHPLNLTATATSLEIEVNSYRLKAGGHYVSRKHRIERSRKNGC